MLGSGLGNSFIIFFSKKIIKLFPKPPCHLTDELVCVKAYSLLQRFVKYANKQANLLIISKL
jgi:hypothetical protein